MEPAESEAQAARLVEKIKISIAPRRGITALAVLLPFVPRGDDARDADVGDGEAMLLTPRRRRRHRRHSRRPRRVGSGEAFEEAALDQLLECFLYLKVM